MSVMDHMRTQRKKRRAVIDKRKNKKKTGTKSRITQIEGAREFNVLVSLSKIEVEKRKLLRL